MHLLLPNYFISDDTGLFLGTSIGHLYYLNIRFLSDNLPTTLPSGSLVSFLNENVMTRMSRKREKWPGDGNVGIDKEVVGDLLDGEGLGQK